MPGACLGIIAVNLRLSLGPSLVDNYIHCVGRVGNSRVKCDSDVVLLSQGRVDVIVLNLCLLDCLLEFVWEVDT